ncbi:MAG: hypothetical protein GWN87_17525, partial [Desulfuromonadales bacterium]|nr:hypothetical protein [Desulfuromonadales bacterium]
MKPFDEHRLRQTLDRLPKSLKGSDNGLAELLDDIRRERERLGSLLEDSDQAGMERLLIK